MPRCINDKNKYYKESELSPKGLGYSSSSEEIGITKLGNDESIWN
jgi:hypothetical protein